VRVDRALVRKQQVRVMLEKKSDKRPVLFDRLPASWVVLAGTLLIVVALALLAAAPIHWLYGDWAPARDFRDATLEDVVGDFEATGILPKGSTWASPDLKLRRVTVRYSFYHEPSTIIEIMAQKAGIVIAGPADFRCSLCGGHILGPVHIRPAADHEAGVQWVLPSEVSAAVPDFPK
jgi:hypothetical protein